MYKLLFIVKMKISQNADIFLVVLLTTFTISTAFTVHHEHKANKSSIPLHPRTVTCEDGLFCSGTVYATDLYALCPSSDLICDCDGASFEPCPTTEPPYTCPPCDPCPTTTTQSQCTCPTTTTTTTTYTCPTQYPTTTCPPPVTCPPIFTCPPPTCPTPPACQTCPTTTTSSPCLGTAPTFSSHIYQTSLASWPREGQLLHLGIEASTPDDDLILYELISPPSFIILDNNRDIRFTSDVSEGAFVGPNNVLIGTVAASVYGQPSRRSVATTVIIFPRSVQLGEGFEGFEFEN